MTTVRVKSIVREFLAPCSVLIAVVMSLFATAHGQEANIAMLPQWIWTSEQMPSEVPHCSCYFRKTIYLPENSTGEIRIAADDVYELFVNGKSAGSGNNSESLTAHDISPYLKQGRNVLAVKVDNRNGQSAGLAAAVMIQPEVGPPRKYMTNPTWRTSLRVLPLWNTTTYRDGRWAAARNLGTFGEVQLEESFDPQPTTTATPSPESVTKSTDPPPAAIDMESPFPDEQLAADPADEEAPAETDATTAPATEDVPDHAPAFSVPVEDHPDFSIRPGFQIQHIAGHSDTGSLIAMAFNEFGQILASQEGGPLLMVYDSNQNGTPDQVRICCKSVFSCQGILCLSGDVFVVADGPVGMALYRLSDSDHDGDYEKVTALLRFEGPQGEHGPHGLALGPDGKIYMTFGNHTKITQPFAVNSPYKNYYEGELLAPRFEDPLGHAQGIRAPGGGILRIDLEGRKVELFAGGLRNAYDLAFNLSGDLFTHDSDMESDIGTPWHRPTRLINATAGGEYGWRSGWAKWPDYLVDTLPPVLKTGRGSPSGAIVYDHWAYPAKYRGVLFSCDWSQGEVNAYRFDRRGAGYAATKESFLRGKPLNVTDIDVGPDGWLYFCTGGRGTRGNIFRVVWTEGVPEEQKQLGNGVVRAIRQPQVDSAWGRQAISTIRRDLPDWDLSIRAFVANRVNAPADRARGMQLMHLVGPPPADIELRELSRDPEPLVRSKAAYLMGLIGNPMTSARLAEMLADETAFVRRSAAEALARNEQQVTVGLLSGMLNSPDRTEAWAARRLLEKNTTQKWYTTVLQTHNKRLFIQGATAMLIADPSHDLGLKIIDRFADLTAGFVNDVDFVDMLRVVHIALERCQISAEEVPALRQRIAAEFPAGNTRINRELAELVVYLKAPDAVNRMLEYLESDVPAEEKLLVAMDLSFMKDGWSADQRLRMLRYLENADASDGGTNLARYVDLARKATVKQAPMSQLLGIFDHGEDMPKTALAALFAIPEESDEQFLSTLESLDRRIVDKKGMPFIQLRVGLVAVLARGGYPSAMAYLREVYDRDPERRQAIAMGLAQQPAGRNWDYLVRSIPMLEGDPALEVLEKLRTVNFAPEEPEHLRQAILCGLRLKDQGAEPACRLLQHWVGTTPPTVGETWDSQLQAWQDWYVRTYPNLPQATLPIETGSNTWTYDDLATFLGSSEGQNGDPQRGAAVYVKAQCASCHIHGQHGTDLGPDLTTISRRFQVREILESIIYPSQVIPDQYASSTVILADGQQIQGLVVERPDKKVHVVPAAGEPRILAADDIDEILPNSSSSMPEGLLNELQLQEIADLFAFLLADTSPANVAEQPGPQQTR